MLFQIASTVRAEGRWGALLDELIGGGAAARRARPRARRVARRAGALTPRGPGVYPAAIEMSNSEGRPFSITTSRDDGTLTLKVIGELDLATANDLEQEIATSSGGGEHINLDFSECGFIDSTGLQAVIGNARKLRDRGGRLTVSNLEGEVLALFEMTGLLVEGSAVERL